MASNNNLMVRLLLNTQGFDTNIQKSTQQVRQFQARISEVGQNVSAFGDGLGINIGQLTKFATAAGVATAAGKVLSDAFMKNESNADAFNSALEQSKAAYSSFLNTINGGSWSNFFSNMEKAIKDAKELYSLMDRADTLKTFNDPIIAHYERLIAEERLKLKNPNLSKKEREQAQQNIQTYTHKKETYQKQTLEAKRKSALESMYAVIDQRARSLGANVSRKDIVKWVNASLLGKAPYLKNTPKDYSFTDDMESLHKELKEKGMVKTVRTQVNQFGVSSTRPISYFDISKLSKQDQLKYALATAFYEGEGDLASPREILADIDREEAANFREDRRNSVYLAGRGGGTSNPDKDKPNPDKLVYKKFTMEKIKELFKEDFGDAVANSFKDDRIAQAYINLLKNVDNEFTKRQLGLIPYEQYQRSRMNIYSSFAQSAVNNGNIELANAAYRYVGVISQRLEYSEYVLNAFNSLTSDIDRFSEGLKSTDVDKLKANRTALKNIVENYDKNLLVVGTENLSIMLDTLQNIISAYDVAIQKQEAWNTKMDNFKNIQTTLDVSANAVNSIGSAFKSAANAAQQAGDVMKAKSLETTGFLFQATAQIGEMIAEVYKLCIVNGVASAAKLPYPASLVAMATIIGTISSLVATGFSTFSNQKYASGGIVQGSGSGWSDSVPTLLSNGEMVLNRRQQGNLFALLDGNRISDSLSNGKVEFKISGQNLVGTLNNYNKKTSKVL